MSKYFLRLFVLVGGIVAIVLVFEAMLPRGYDFQSSVTIDRPPAAIFGQLESLQQWPNWSQQFNVGKIEQLKITYGGTERGVGAAQTWTERRGTGKLWITESVPHQKVVYESEFASFPKLTGVFLLTPAEENQTKVTLRHYGRLPATPLFGMMRMTGVFSSQMQHEYQKSLAALKQHVESEPFAPPVAKTSSVDNDDSLVESDAN